MKGSDAARYVNEAITFEQSENAIFNPDRAEAVGIYLQLDAQLHIVAGVVVPDTHTQTKYRNPCACVPRYPLAHSPFCRIVGSYQGTEDEDSVSLRVASVLPVSPRHLVGMSHHSRDHVPTHPPSSTHRRRQPLRLSLLPRATLQYSVDDGHHSHQHGGILRSRCQIFHRWAGPSRPCGSSEEEDRAGLVETSGTLRERRGGQYRGGESG